MLSLFILTSVASKPVKAGVEGRYTNGVAAAISELWLCISLTLDIPVISRTCTPLGVVAAKGSAKAPQPHFSAGCVMNLAFAAWKLLRGKKS